MNTLSNDRKRSHSGSDRVMDPLEVFTGGAHQQVMKVSKVCSLSDFFCENVSDIAFTADVGDCEGAINHSFSNRVFFILDVTIALVIML